MVKPELPEGVFAIEIEEQYPVYKTRKKPFTTLDRIVEVDAKSLAILRKTEKRREIIQGRLEERQESKDACKYDEYKTGACTPQKLDLKDLK